MRFYAWPSITQLHNVVKDIEKSLKTDSNSLPHSYCSKKEILYKSKIKLHGSNAGICIQQVDNEIKLKVQSRNLFQDEKSALGKLVLKHEKKFIESFLNNRKKLSELLNEKEINNFVIFGEICGPKIQKGVALSSLKNDIFAIFALLVNEDYIIYDPKEIEKFLPSELPQHVYVLPWYKNEKNEDYTYSLDFMNQEKLEKKADDINLQVSKIDKEDPWVYQVFKIKGHGEGIVLYPLNVGDDHLVKNGVIKTNVYEVFSFKAKGDKHKNVQKQKSAQVNPQTAKGAKAYAELMVTQARCEQGAKEVGELNLKFTGKFVQWIEKDVLKEGKDELEASKLTWKEVKSEVLKAASSWYKEKCMSLKKK